MRLMTILILTGALALIGCGSDDGGGAGAGGTGGSGGAGGSGGMNGTQPPQITMVAWEPVDACTAGIPSDYTVTVTATDPDSDQAELIYDGSVTGCTGQIDDATSTVSCPNAAPYNGSVVVEDADGNFSNEANFTIGVCETGSLMP